MLRFPMHGFARRVDDAVARAMTFLMSRDDSTARPLLLTVSGAKPKAREPASGA
jgi:hypothetical protein